MKTKCSLCGGKTDLFEVIRNKKYFSCRVCRAVILDPSERLSPEEEK